MTLCIYWRIAVEITDNLSFFAGTTGKRIPYNPRYMQHSYECYITCKWSIFICMYFIEQKCKIFVGLNFFIISIRETKFAELYNMQNNNYRIFKTFIIRFQTSCIPSNRFQATAIYILLKTIEAKLTPSPCI